MGTLGVQEMIVIFLIALVLFGPKKLPELGRTIGKALTEFRRASSDLKATFEREMQNLERETESVKQVAHSTANEIYSHTDYTNFYDESGARDPDHIPQAGNVITASPAADPSHAITDGHHDPSATNNPSTVSASEVPGAESQGQPETASVAIAPHPPVEGTVPRSGSPEPPQKS